MTDLILALDLTDRERALEIAGACAPHIDLIKVGYPLVLATGLDIAADLRSLGRPLVADFKVADVPNTCRLICERVFASGFSAVIAHGFCGRDSLDACVKVAEDSGGECFVVAEMSHPGAADFFSAPTPERITRMAVEAGADGIIAPATRPMRVRILREIAPDLKIYSPGVGAQGGEIGPLTGVVDGIIVGRSIYDDPDPGRAAERFASACR
ncbi:MAG: orotidine-5'-phosphate decarboxylase [Methanoculleaceae archaeon]